MDRIPLPWEIWWADVKIGESLKRHAVLIVSAPGPLREAEVLRLDPERLHETGRGVQEQRACRNVTIGPEETEPLDPKHGEAGPAWKHTLDGKTLLYARYENLGEPVCTLTMEARRRLLKAMQKDCHDTTAPQIFRVLKKHLGKRRLREAPKPPAPRRTRQPQEKPRHPGVPARRMSRAAWAKQQKENS